MKKISTYILNLSAKKFAWSIVIIHLLFLLIPIFTFGMKREQLFSSLGADIFPLIGLMILLFPALFFGQVLDGISLDLSVDPIMYIWIFPLVYYGLYGGLIYLKRTQKHKQLFFALGIFTFWFFVNLVKGISVLWGEF